MKKTALNWAVFLFFVGELGGGASGVAAHRSALSALCRLLFALYRVLSALSSRVNALFRWLSDLFGRLTAHSVTVRWRSEVKVGRAHRNALSALCKPLSALYRGLSALSGHASALSRRLSDLFGRLTAHSITEKIRLK